MTNALLQTIETDLKAGVSYLESEAETVGLYLWNVLKTTFIALEPAEAQILTDVVQSAVTAASGGDSIEQIETAALNTATAEQKAVLAKAGSGVVQTVIAAVKANA
jgi:hypothetical protein